MIHMVQPMGFTPLGSDFSGIQQSEDKGKKGGVMTEKQLAEGLPIVDNWRRWLVTGTGQVSEYPFFTDVRLTGLKVVAGPYTFYNTLAQPRRNGMTVAGLVFRYVESREAGRPEVRLKTDTGTYHGGWLVDEAAAMVSLVLGARVKPGGQSRIFESQMTDDPMGRPIGWYDTPAPGFIPREQRPIAPVLFQPRAIGALEILETLPLLSQDQSVSLMRAARLFQDPLWLAEQEPELTWLMLVSAIEGVSNVWKRQQGTASARLRFSKPEFVDRLTEAGGSNLVEWVAHEFADTLGVTRKFVEFCVEFLPHPPVARPTEALQISWDEEFWVKALKKIYGYRSKALHRGIPFPAPMCQPPFMEKEGAAPSERGTIGLAVNTMGATWNANDLPISLNLFVQFTQSVLLNWLMFVGSGADHSPRKIQAVHRLTKVLRDRGG